MKTSPSSSPTMRSSSTASASMATWITARRTPRSGGDSRMRGSRWRVLRTSASRTGFQWMNGAFVWPPTNARRSAHRSNAGRDQFPGGGFCADEIRRLDEEVRPTAVHGDDVLRSRASARARRDRAADLLVHGLHGRHDQTGPARRESGRDTQMAHGALPSWSLLEAGHAERLPGRRFLDFLSGDGREPDGGCVALCSIRDVEVGVAQEVDRGPDLHSGQRYP